MSGGKSIAAAGASTAGSVFVAKLIPKLLKLSYNQKTQEFVNIKATMINKKKHISNFMKYIAKYKYIPTWVWEKSYDRTVFFRGSLFSSFIRLTVSQYLPTWSLCSLFWNEINHKVKNANWHWREPIL